MGPDDEVVLPPGGEPTASDDGFSPEERAAFAEMQANTSTEDLPADPVGGEVAPAVDPNAPAPAAAAAAAAPGEEDDDDGEDDAAAAAAGAPAADGSVPKPKRRVSAAKFQRAEAARVAAEKRADELLQNQTRLDERMRMLNEVLTPPAAPAVDAAAEDPEPDAEKDIFAWVAWKKRDDVRFRESIAKSQQQTQQSTEEQALATTYTNDARSYASKEPQFVPAYQFLMSSRTFELAEFFYNKDLSDPAVTLTPQETAHIQKVKAGEEKALVKQAIEKGQSPAARVFAMAKARGFRPAAAAAAPAVDPAAKPAADAAAATAAPGGAPKPPGSLADPPAAVPPKVADEIARIRNGVEASKTLSDAGGAPAAPLTAEKLANMSEEDFGALMERLTPAQQAQYMGQ